MTNTKIIEHYEAVKEKEKRYKFLNLNEIIVDEPVTDYDVKNEGMDRNLPFSHLPSLGRQSSHDTDSINEPTVCVNVDVDRVFYSPLKG